MIDPSRIHRPIKSSDGWFRQLPYTVGNHCLEPKEAQALHEFLSGQISAQTAAVDYSSSISGAPADRRNMYRIWIPIIDVTSQHPETPEQLIQLLAEV